MEFIGRDKKTTFEVVGWAIDRTNLAEVGLPGSKFMVIGYNEDIIPLFGGALAELRGNPFVHLVSDELRCREQFAAISAGLSHLAASTAQRRVLIVLSDGVEASRLKASPTELRRYAAEKNIDTFGIVIHGDNPYNTDDELHDAIPDTRYFNTDKSVAWNQIERTLVSIRERLSRFRARFDPGLLPRDGGLHRVEIVHEGQRLASTVVALPKSTEPAVPVDVPVAVAPAEDAPRIGCWTAVGAGLLAGIAGMASLGWAFRRRRRALEPCTPP